MPVLDVFDSDAFSFVSLTKAINLMGYVPDMLSSMPDLFEPVPVRTKEVWIERQGAQPALIQTTARGAPVVQVSGDKRDARAYNTVRLAQGSRIHAEELQFIRRFGTEIDIKDLQTEIARRMFKINANHELTMEAMRLGVVTKGQAIDYGVSNSTVLYDWTQEFASPPPAARSLSTLGTTAFSLSAGTLGSVRLNCNTVVRGIHRNLSMVGMPAQRARIVGLCGDSFYDQLTTHPEIRATYLNWEAASELRESVGAVWKPFPYAGVEFLNYRGTDDVSGSGSHSLVVPTTTNCYFFPRGAGVFQMAYAPGEKFEMLGTPGQERYAMIVRDVQRDMWADVEVYSYPLPVCVLPQALALGTA